MVTRPANGTDIVRAAMALRIADLELQQADEAHDWHRDFDGSDTWLRYEAAQQAYSEARAALMALCDTRLRAYDPR